MSVESEQHHILEKPTGRWVKGMCYVILVYLAGIQYDKLMFFIATEYSRIEMSAFDHY